MAAALLSSVVSYFTAAPHPQKGSCEECPIELFAMPGLMTWMDVALYQTMEAQLTGTLTASHALMRAWLDLQRYAAKHIAEDVHFYQSCLDVACDAIHLMATDRWANSANLSDPYPSLFATLQSTSNIGSSTSSTHHPRRNQNDSMLDTGRKRFPIHQRRRDCWESPRLFCPDYVWADEVIVTSQRWLRNLIKNMPPIQDEIIALLLRDDIPVRLLQFRAAVEAESCVLKRLHLIKAEYRAPFRAFLDAHVTVSRAPSLTTVQEYWDWTTAPSTDQKAQRTLNHRRTRTKERLQTLLETPSLIEALALEQQIELFESSMSQSLNSFCDAARFLDHKRARIKLVPGIVKTEMEVVRLQELLGRLRVIQPSKDDLWSSSLPSSSPSYIGIRPLLLDLQGIPRDDEALAYGDSINFVSDDPDHYVERFLDDLETLHTLCFTRDAFVTESKKVDWEFPSSLIRGIASLDRQLFLCYFHDWCTMVKRQTSVTRKHDFDELAEKIRQAELHVSLANATHASLQVVRARLESLHSDRKARFHVLQGMLQELCLREFNLHVKLHSPSLLDREKALLLRLPPLSAPGVFGLLLEQAGEPLPI